MERTIKQTIALLICYFVANAGTPHVFLLDLFMLEGLVFWFMKVVQMICFILMWVFAFRLVMDGVKLLRR